MTAPAIYPAELAARMTPGAPYRPSNGTEGEVFYERWCAGCALFEEGDCDIYLGSLLLGIGHEDYPPELVYDERGQPSCSARRSGGAAERCGATPDLFG